MNFWELSPDLGLLYLLFFCSFTTNNTYWQNCIIFSSLFSDTAVACDWSKTQKADANPLKLNYLPGLSFTLSSYIQLKFPFVGFVWAVI